MDNTAKDIGMEVDEREPVPTTDIINDEEYVLRDIKSLIGSEQVTRKRLEGILAWIVERALNVEQDDNWKDAYVEVPEGKVSRCENIIYSHVVYKLKVDEKRE